jgi:hypothetical protein
LKAFKIVKHDSYHDSEFDDDSATMTDEEDEADDYVDLRIPINKKNKNKSQRRVKFKEESIDVPSPLATPHHNTRGESNPADYESTGGFFTFLLNQLETFLLNPVSDNVLLASIVRQICSQPVRVDSFDEEFKSITSPFDSTHEHLTYLHMLLFDLPMSTSQPDKSSLLFVLHRVSKQVEEFMRDRKVIQLINMIHEEGNLADLTLPKLHNPWFKNCFDLHKKQLFNIVIFKELLKALVACLAAKQVVADMLLSYEQACVEDTTLEAAMTVFQRKRLNKDK